MQTHIENILAKLVSIPTLSDNHEANEQALDYIANSLAAANMTIKRFNLDGHGALVASSRPSNLKHPAVLLAAHVDVVPAAPDQFQLRVQNERLIGRGVFDMKFAIATYLHIADRLKDRIHEYDFGIMITTDEESGGPNSINGTQRLIQLGYLPQVCILPDAAGSGWELEAAAKGIWRFILTSEGKTAHGSRPWETDSASFRLVDALSELKSYFQHQGPDTDTLNIAVLEGGLAFNQIPTKVWASIELRLAGPSSLKNLQSIITGICKKYGLEAETKTIKHPITNDLHQPLVEKFADSIERVTAKRPSGVLSFGGSDANFFQNAGVPYVVTAPIGGGHHSADEWIDRGSFLQFQAILQDYITRSNRRRKPSGTLAHQSRAL